MSLVSCPECGKEVSDKAANCPNCGWQQQFSDQEQIQRQAKNQSSFGIASMILGITGFLFSAVFIGGILGIIGLVFGIIGICKKNVKYGCAVTGIVMGTMAILITFFMIISLMFDQSVKSVNSGPAKISMEESLNNQTENDVREPEKAADYSNVEKDYDLCAGYYTAGIDLPAGRCNITAVSGSGNLTSSNVYNGGVNEMFGVDDGSGWYTQSFKGLKYPEGTVLEIAGDLVVHAEFTQIESDFCGRNYDENNKIELSAGNYISGTDFPSGVYSIIAVSGTGNLSSSNMYNGGINEIFGVDDGSGWVTSEVYNVSLPESVSLEISGGLVVDIIPSNPIE